MPHRLKEFLSQDFADQLELAAITCRAQTCEFSLESPAQFTKNPDFLYPIKENGKICGTLGLIGMPSPKLDASQLRSLEIIARQILHLMEFVDISSSLVESNRYLALALEGANLGIWDWNLVTNEVVFDRRWCEMLGLVYEETPMQISTWENLVHPDDLSMCYRNIQDHLNQKTSYYESIHRMRHKSGNWIYILDRGRISNWDSAGKPTRFTGTHFDITVQRTLEHQLLEAQSIAKIGSWYFNLRTQEQVWTSELYRIFEIPEPQSHESLHQLYRSRIHPDEINRLDEIIDRAIRYGEDFTYDHRIVLDDQRIKFVHGIGKVIRDEKGQPVALNGTCQDRTASVEQETGLQSLLESMSEGLVVQNEQGQIVQYNPAALKILGLSDDQLLGRTSMDPRWRAIREDGSDFPGEDHPAMMALRTKQPVNKATMGLILPNEELRWISINSIPMKTTQGWNALTTFTDITAIIQAREEKQFMLDTIGVGVWKFNPNTGKLDWDRYMFELFEVNPKSFKGHVSDWENCLSEESRSVAPVQLARAIAGERDFSMNFEIKTKNGKKKVIGAQGRVLRNDAAEAIMIYGINWDRTKEVELEKNLQLERAKSLHQSKLATIGQLAAGVGHEINNPLAIISGQIVLAQQMLKDLGISQDHILERFRKIDNSVSRIANIVKGLRTFARSDDEQITIFNVHEPILETFDLLKDMYQKEGVVLKINNSAPAAYLTGNRGRFQQVLINLISNAKDASEGKQDRHIEIHTSIEKEVLVLKIKDNGCGVEPELQEKIFEPFFTTKETSKGTGIGLSLVSTIIKELRGKVELESRIGEGSVFSVTLPVQLTIKQMVPPSSVTLSKLEQLPLRVLIVDDEEDLRDILASTLSRICTSVESVESAELAFKVMENKPIDVIISDIKMPKMDGFEFLRTLRERKDLQQPRFIFISGGVEMTRDQEQIMTTETDGFIPKPFRIEQIQEHLKTLVMKS